MEEHVRPTVAGIIEKNRKILLVKRGTEPFKGFWCIPGGHIDFGERAEDTVIREVKEETGLDFKPEFFSYFDEIVESVGKHYIPLIFTGQVSGKEKIDNREIVDIGWFSYEEANKMKLAFRHNEILNKWIKSKMDM